VAGFFLPGQNEAQGNGKQGTILTTPHQTLACNLPSSNKYFP